jgi:glutathione S-transferase
MRHLGAKHGYYSSDPLEAYNIDNLCEYGMELSGTIAKPNFVPEDKKEEACNKVFDEQIPAFMKAFDAKCVNGEWLVGNRLTIADFVYGNVYVNYFANDNVAFAKDRFKSTLEEYPNFKAFGEKFKLENKKHIDARKSSGI